MTMSCKVCSHPDRKKIDRELLAGASQSDIARRYGISKDSVHRHYRDHIGPAAVAGQRRAAENHAQALLQDMEDLMQTSKDILADAMADGSRTLSLKAIKEVRNNIETLGKVVFSMKGNQDLDPEEVEEFRQWQATKDITAEELAILSPEDVELLTRLCVEKVSEMNGMGEFEDFRSKSRIMRKYGPDTVEVMSDTRSRRNSPKKPLVSIKNDDSELVVDPSDSSLKPRTIPRAKTTDQDSDKPRPRMRRTRPPGRTRPSE